MDFKKIIGLDSQENYTLINTNYHRGRRNPQTNKWQKGTVSLVFKNNDTQEKKLVQIENPLIEAYLAKEGVIEQFKEYYGVTNDFNLCDIPIEMTDVVDLHYDDAPMEIAKLAGQEYVNYCTTCMKMNRRKEMGNMHKWNRIFSSDVNIEDFYRIKSLEYFGPRNTHLSKGFLDIEVDIYNQDFNIDEATGDAPVNAVTIVSADEKRVYTLLLRDENNPLIQELEDDMPNFLRELHDEFDEEFGEMEYKIKFMDSELDLIIMIFKIINTIKFDFVLIWNMRFDIRYLINRLTRLTNIPPSEIICHPDYHVKDCYFKVDNHPDHGKIKQKTDEFIVSAYTDYIDQMILYATVRKMKDLPSYSLDEISKKEVGAEKLSYKEIGSIAQLPHKNYRLFVKYNIKDVLLQYKIENSVDDVQFMFQKAYTSGTRYTKAFKETTYWRNLGFISDKQYSGVILSNNLNIDYSSHKDDDDEEEVHEKFEGAVVGRPELNSNTGAKIFGKKSNHVYNSVADQDIESMYPTNINACNIYPSTQYGRVILDKNKITDRELIDDMDRYDRGGKFVEDLEINEAILFCYTWHNLPSATDILNNALKDEKLKHKIVDMRTVFAKNNKKKKLKKLYKSIA